MKILVLNCGSSSIKYKLFEMDHQAVIAQGGIEKIGLKDSFLKLSMILFLSFLSFTDESKMSKVTSFSSGMTKS